MPQQHGRTVVGGHEQVDVAVAVEVAAGQPAADSRLREPAAHRASDVAEARRRLVQEQLRRLRVADVAADVPDGVVDVAVGDDEVETAVEIDVGEGAAEPEPGPRRRADAGVRRDVLVVARVLAPR